jgi:ubiquinone/menaquinone biosynthesis C-methylase UbiE
VLGRLREWRIDRMTDRIARRPHGRRARAVYGADDVHSFAWEPVLDALQLTSADALLDVGCGGGVFLRRALQTGCRAAGVDHSREMVRLARKNTGGAVPIVHGSAERLPFRDDEFTAVSCLVAFFFFPDPVVVLREFRRVLDRTRGRAAIYTTAPEMKGTPAAPYPLATRGHFYEDDELEQLPYAAGFAESRVTRRGTGAQLLVVRG